MILDIGCTKAMCSRHAYLLMRQGLSEDQVELLPDSSTFNFANGQKALAREKCRIWLSLPQMKNLGVSLDLRGKGPEEQGAEPAAAVPFFVRLVPAEGAPVPPLPREGEEGEVLPQGELNLDGLVPPPLVKLRQRLSKRTELLKLHPGPDLVEGLLTVGPRDAPSALASATH